MFVNNLQPWLSSVLSLLINLPLRFSFIISLGGLKSPRDIGLKEIQKLAKSGNITIDRTINIVGNKRKKASFRSF